MDSGTECILSKYVDDTKLCGPADMVKGTNAIQRDLDRWAQAYLRKFNKALHLDWRKSQEQI